MPLKGSIYWEEAYALGKMLDHSGFHGNLVRGITPSDHDFVIDADGSLLVGELVRNTHEWSELSKGQRWAQESLVRCGLHCAVLCTHSITPETGRKINTWNDIETFQVMIWHHGFVFSKVLVGAMLWQKFVRCWCNKKTGPLEVHRAIIAADVERAKADPANVIQLRARP